MASVLSFTILHDGHGWPGWRFFCPEEAGGELTVSPCRLDVGLLPGRLLAHVDGEAGLNTPGGGGSRQKRWRFAEAAPTPWAPLPSFKSS